MEGECKGLLCDRKDQEMEVENGITIGNRKSKKNRQNDGRLLPGKRKKFTIRHFVRLLVRTH